MDRKFSSLLLRSMRNDIPIEKLIGDILKIPSKRSEGYFRFLCPICSGFNTAAKKATNLARCFRCGKNFNPIDMVMAVHTKSFLESVKFLKPIWLRFYRYKGGK